jgi:hypothetical protein
MALDNYQLIARNIAFLYDYLLQSEPYNAMPEDKRFAFTGILYAFAYLHRGEIRYRHLDDCVKGASFGHCIVGMLSRQIRNPFEHPGRTEEDKLIDFTVNLEAHLMIVDNRQIDPNDVMAAVISKRDSIRDAIKETRAIINKKGFPNEVATLVQEYTSSPDCLQAREWIADYSSQV